MAVRSTGVVHRLQTVCFLSAIHRFSYAFLSIPSSSLRRLDGVRAYSARQSDHDFTCHAAESATETYASPPPIAALDHWRKISRWDNVRKEDFMTYRWQTANTIDRQSKHLTFLSDTLPDAFAPGRFSQKQYLITKDEYLTDVVEGMKIAPMAVRLTPHILSMIDWKDPLNDPILRQFIPLRSAMIPDHHKLVFDSLQETTDSPVPGLVHRYQDRVLFLATTVCPVYCRFCTRSYAVGSDTEALVKTSMKPTRRRWDAMLQYIEEHPVVQDVVISGGDSYYLQPQQLRYIGEKLLSIPHVKRFRFASKGLAVCPMRITDPADDWARTLIEISSQGRKVGKHVALHTHFNHPNEINWITGEAAQHLFVAGVTVRNQTVLLRGVNDNVPTMSALIRKLADINIQPYYVYQGDMVKGVEDMRTPLSTMLHLEKHIRGRIAGFMTPAFIVDLPGGGGKQLANSFDSYNEGSGVSTWTSPGVVGNKVFYYHDPVRV